MTSLAAGAGSAEAAGAAKPSAADATPKVPHSTHSTICTTSYRTDGGAGVPAGAPRLRLLLRPIDSNNVGTLRVLNRAILPVQYKDKFYRDVITYPEEVRQMAYKDANVVGGLACRVEGHPSGEGKRLYIMTLGVLAAYRGLQVGTQLLEHVLDHAAKKMHEVVEVYLHVHTGNQDAIDFYSKFGFVQTEVKKGYYTARNVEPPDAAVLVRQNVLVYENAKKKVQKNLIADAETKA